MSLIAPARGERRHFTVRGTSIADERLGGISCIDKLGTHADHVVIRCDLPESELAGHEIAFDSRETSSSGVVEDFLHEPVA